MTFPGDWVPYCDALYAVFSHDFLSPRGPDIGVAQVTAPRGSFADGKNDTFWHCTSEAFDKKAPANRTPCFRRCERVGWIRPLLEAIGTDRVVSWTTTMPWKEKRLMAALPDYSYVVVLSDRSTYMTLITSYCVEQEHRREKMKDQHRRDTATHTAAPMMRAPRPVSTTGSIPVVARASKPKP